MPYTNMYSTVKPGKKMTKTDLKQMVTFTQSDLALQNY